MKTFKIENLKKNEGIEINQNDFENIIDGPDKEKYIDLAKNSFFALNTTNHRYYITKLAGKKKFVKNRNIPGQLRTEIGMFKLELEYKFNHPNNFSENEFVTQNYTVII